MAREFETGNEVDQLITSSRKELTLFGFALGVAAPTALVAGFKSALDSQVDPTTITQFVAAGSSLLSIFISGWSLEKILKTHAVLQAATTAKLLRESLQGFKKGE